MQWLEDNWTGATSATDGGRFWRAVEAQHVVATMRLVDTLGEQALLEQILEASKPPVQPGDAALHYLLTTPFRYVSPYASRFRRAGAPGIWYGADSLQTACAEVGYWRWRFYSESAGLRQGDGLVTEHTLFQAAVSGLRLDLTAAPWTALANHWTHPNDYSACHRLADHARAVGIQWLRYASARHRGGQCAAVFDAHTLRLSKPAKTQTWFSKVTAGQVIFSREAEGFAFSAASWALTPQLA